MLQQRCSRRASSRVSSSSSSSSPLPESPPPPPHRRRRRQRDTSPEVIDPTGRVAVPDDPNLSTAPDPVGEQIIADAFPHLPCPLSRDPRDKDQPLVPPTPLETNSNGDNDQGGVRRQRVLSFSKPQKGHFSYRRRRPDVSFLRRIISEL